MKDLSDVPRSENIYGNALLEIPQKIKVSSTRIISRGRECSCDCLVVGVLIR